MENSTGVMAADMIGRGDHEYALPFYGTKRPLLIDLIDEPDEKIGEWGYNSYPAQRGRSYGREPDHRSR